jgi:hypothetical protein
MKVVVIHKPLGLMPPDMMKAGVELGKKSWLSRKRWCLAGGR